MHIPSRMLDFQVSMYRHVRPFRYIEKNDTWYCVSGIFQHKNSTHSILCVIKSFRAGKSLQSKAEAEAALKYRAGLALLREMEELDTKRAAPVHR